MIKYDFESMGHIWKDHAKDITEKGVFVAHSGNWDLWEYRGIIYDIPIFGSSCSPSVFCSVSELHSHLYKLRQIFNYNSLIPEYWEHVNREFLSGFGIS